MPFSSKSERLDKTALRRQLRTRRRELDAGHRSAAAQRVAQIVLERLHSQRWHRVAAYAAVASELSLAPLFARWPDTVDLYLPAIDRQQQLSFRRWHVGTPLAPGPHGIAQPDTQAAVIEVADLDALLLPLLGFDRHGTRLGSGAGYYDRACALRRQQQAPPSLIGIAYAVQELPQLPREPWDVPLDAVITEDGWLSVHGAAVQ